MKRTPLRRTPFRQKRDGPSFHVEPKPWSKPTVRPLSRGTYEGTTSGTEVKKECVSQHSGYMAAVRELGYCMRCRKACRPAFCHADEGKGTGIKTDCRRGWPGCTECHWIVGTSGQYPKEERRALEADLARRTREAVRAAGTWPRRLAQLDE